MYRTSIYRMDLKIIIYYLFTQNKAGTYNVDKHLKIDRKSEYIGRTYVISY